MSNNSRPLTGELALSLSTAGWNWWNGPDASRETKPGEKYSSLTRLRGLSGLHEFDKAANLAEFGSHSWLPVAAHTRRPNSFSLSAVDTAIGVDARVAGFLGVTKLSSSAVQECGIGGWRTLADATGKRAGRPSSGVGPW
ncbi:MAG: hypothetical protein HUU20_07380 [Pirellulales bacterium]|nr:hypothetical protein [Pirellulales bacterium]